VAVRVKAKVKVEWKLENGWRIREGKEWK